MEHKARSIISTAIIFLGMVMPLGFPKLFWFIAPICALVAALLTFWVFEEKPSIKRIKEDWFTILFVGFYSLSLVLFSYLAPNPIVQGILVIISAFSMYYVYTVASRLKRGYTPALYLRNVISIIALVGVFASLSNVLRWATYFDNSYIELAVIFGSFVSVFIISEFLFEAQGIERSLLYSLVLSFGVSQICWLSSFWLISYPQSLRITNLGVPLPAIFSTVYYYLFWGLSQHRIEGTLTRKVLWEYIVIASSFSAILFLTAQWMPNIIG
jgi:hypothetical protein